MRRWSGAWPRRVLAVLDILALGDEIVVDDPLGGRHLYWVTSRRAFPKSDLPAELFTATGPPHLVLVTWRGAFDEATRRYADNVVVVADPALRAARRSGPEAPTNGTLRR